MVVLVAYATDHGSTRGIADRIAGRLQVLGVGDEESMFPPRMASAAARWIQRVTLRK